MGKCFRTCNMLMELFHSCCPGYAPSLLRVLRQPNLLICTPAHHPPPQKITVNCRENFRRRSDLEAGQGAADLSHNKEGDAARSGSQGDADGMDGAMREGAGPIGKAAAKGKAAQDLHGKRDEQAANGGEREGHREARGRREWEEAAERQWRIQEEMELHHSRALVQVSGMGGLSKVCSQDKSVPLGLRARAHATEPGERGEGYYGYEHWQQYHKPHVSSHTNGHLDLLLPASSHRTRSSWTPSAPRASSTTWTLT